MLGIILSVGFWFLVSLSYVFNLIYVMFIKCNILWFSTNIGGASNLQRTIRHVDSFGDSDSKVLTSLLLMVSEHLLRYLPFSLSRFVMDVDRILAKKN